MLRNVSKTMWQVAVLVCCAMPVAVVAQNAAPASLESQLESVYKPTQLESNTKTVISPGTLLKLTKSNLLYETPIDNMFRCNATVKQDATSIPGGACIGMNKGAGNFLQSGQLLYLTKIKINAAKDIVTFELVEAAAGQNGSAAWPTFKTGVNFTFEHGYLAKADPGQIADLINTVLPLDNGGGDSSQAAAQPMPAAKAAAQAYAPQSQYQQQPAAAAGQQVQIGMTEDQVKGILGQPTSSSNFSSTTVYVYQKMITFQNGKVSGIR